MVKCNSQECECKKTLDRFRSYALFLFSLASVEMKLDTVTCKAHAILAILLLLASLQLFSFFMSALLFLVRERQA